MSKRDRKLISFDTLTPWLELIGSKAVDWMRRLDMSSYSTNWPRSSLWRRPTQRSGSFTRNYSRSSRHLIHRRSHTLGANVSHVKYYTKVFEKLKNNPHFAVNEATRIAAIVKKGSLTSQKYIPPVECA
jgi:Endoplasmic reticulum protein ERp29, C-terminal domain